jgi:hypothetical protein
MYSTVPPVYGHSTKIEWVVSDVLPVFASVVYPVHKTKFSFLIFLTKIVPVTLISNIVYRMLLLLNVFLLCLR